MPLGQTTIASTGGNNNTPVSVGNPQRCMQLNFQNNSGNNMRVGDDPSTSASKGIKLGPGGSLSSGTFTSGSTQLSKWYVAGNNGDVLDWQFTPED
jgi:hypothetical protein